MVFSYNWLQSFFSKKLPKPNKLAELLTMHSFEVEEVKKLGRDFILDIDVLPNRGPDCFSHMGIAKEIAAILGYKLQVTGDRLLEEKTIKAKDFVSIEVKDYNPPTTRQGKAIYSNACPRYTARVITNVKVGSSPKWLKQRLKVCGLHPINNIVDIANYVMLEMGQPLHAFDGEKLAGRKIVVRFAKSKEKIVTLDTRARQSRAKGEDEATASSPGEKFDLDSDILVIADEKKPIAIAGIKGGKLPEIDKRTKVVVLESANFNPRVIRRGSQKLNLKTDASIRFEHGIDPNLTELAIDRACYLIQRIARGRIMKGLVDVYPKKVSPKIIRLDLKYVKSLLGKEIPEKETIRILKNLEFNVRKIKKDYLEVSVPTRRLDVSIQEDLIEEIGRIYGYQKIPATFPVSSLVPPKRNLDIFWEDLSKNILKEAGFTEVYNYSFFGEKESKLFGYKERELIEVENPLSQEQKYLRVSLIPNLLKNVERNFREISEIRVFELGRIFLPPQSEKRMLTGLTTRAVAKGEDERSSSTSRAVAKGEDEQSSSTTGEAFYQLKGVVDLLLNKLGIGNLWYDEYRTVAEEQKICWWHPGKCAEIKVDGERIGFLSEISPRILDELSIKSKIVYFDIDFEKLAKLCSEEHEYRPISKFPAAIRDLAVLVPRQVRVEEVLNKIETVGGSLVRDIDLFDIYEGEELPEGKKNLAFHIIYQAEDRTLSSKEIDEIQNKIIKTLESMPGWQVRK